MPMYVSITTDRVKVARGDELPGPTFTKLEGDNARWVMEVLWGAKQDMPDTHGRYYDLLKRGKTIRLRRNNLIAPNIEFAATYKEEALMVASTVRQAEIDQDRVEAELENEAWDLLYKS
jgi:hypothetical protein